MTWLLRQVFLGGSSGHFCPYKWVVGTGIGSVFKKAVGGFASLGSRCDAQCEYISLCPSFLCERSQWDTAATPESPHRLSKPLPPSRPPPEVLLASCLNAVVRVAICFLNFSIIVNKSIPQPWVIGIFLSRNGWFYSFSHSSLCSAIWQLLLIARVFLFYRHYLLLPFCLHDNSFWIVIRKWLLEGLGFSTTHEDLTGV